MSRRGACGRCRAAGTHGERRAADVRDGERVDEPSGSISIAVEPSANPHVGTAHPATAASSIAVDPGGMGRDNVACVVSAMTRIAVNASRRNWSKRGLRAGQPAVAARRERSATTGRRPGRPADPRRLRAATARACRPPPGPAAASRRARRSLASSSARQPPAGTQSAWPTAKSPSRSGPRARKTLARPSPSPHRSKRVRTSAASRRSTRDASRDWPQTAAARRR